MRKSRKPPHKKIENTNKIITIASIKVYVVVMEVRRTQYQIILQKKIPLVSIAEEFMNSTNKNKSPRGISRSKLHLTTEPK
jgi:hypothetical protein